MTSGIHPSIMAMTSGISIPVSVEAKVHAGGGLSYDPAPLGSAQTFTSCGGCRTLWTSDLVTYDAGPDDWFCPLCTA